MIKYLRNGDFSGVFSPYFVKKKFKTHYQGLKFFVFNPKNNKEKIRNKKMKNLLISFGNSDPKNITELVLKSLLRLKQRYYVNVIIGPMFKKKLIENIKFMSQNSKQHKFILKKNIRNLSTFLINSYFAFVSCGLTKYEAIFYKTPSLVIPLNHQTEKMAEILKKKKLIFLSKNIDNLSVDDLTKKINNILKQKSAINILKQRCLSLKLDNKNRQFLKVINFD